MAKASRQPVPGARTARGPAPTASHGSARSMPATCARDASAPCSRALATQTGGRQTTLGHAPRRPMPQNAMNARVRRAHRPACTHAQDAETARTACSLAPPRTVHRTPRALPRPVLPPRCRRARREAAPRRGRGDPAGSFAGTTNSSNTYASDTRSPARVRCAIHSAAWLPAGSVSGCARGPRHHSGFAPPHGPS